ncbi:lipid A phosphate methyltransferase [Tepidamorphus gemmatus]|uniref:Lipid A phosphate methyltransferase n=1 Tax=Tepidamorphus gemmatus TaxID=747076 RepID=A0A4R3MGT0_9HYPH|nr:isoprenylcysteine carboxylmethyltransferase family protein [Tepidamorphus gemmatus]TCT12417.1 lipid A phosphate methyltransferase [Tepidamorphus gemmatus]
MLENELVRQGNWLFRRRSYLPLVILPVAMVAFAQSDWVIHAFGDGVEDIWDFGCLLIALSGLAVRGAIVGFVPRGSSGRTTRMQRAEALNTSGMYSQMRHPLYFANFLIFLGFLLVFKSLLFGLGGALAFFLYYERIMLAEERFMEERFGDAYRHWAQRTPAILPRFSGWVWPELPFSLRTVLRREYPGLYLITVFFLVVEALEAVVVEELPLDVWISEEPVWVMLFFLGTLTYLAIRLIRQHTTWLAVAGR